MTAFFSELFYWTGAVCWACWIIMILWIWKTRTRNSTHPNQDATGNGI